MISHQDKCILIHIPKCAGTSIEKALGHFDEYQVGGRQDHQSMSEIEEAFTTTGFSGLKKSAQKILPIGRVKKCHARNSKNDLLVIREQYDEYYKFTIIRNPWARAYSWYKNMVRHEALHQKYGITAELTFKDFLRNHAGKDLLKPQTWWLNRLDESINLDQAGRIETVQEVSLRAVMPWVYPTSNCHTSCKVPWEIISSIMTMSPSR